MDNEIKYNQIHFLNSITNNIIPEELIIIAGGKLNSTQAIQVYQQAYIARLTDAIGDSHERVWMFLGDELFFEVCREYIKKYKSNTWDLGNVGKNFHFFLKENPPLDNTDYLYDLALVDWNLHTCFHMQQENPPSAEEIVKLENLSDFSILFNNSFILQSSEFQVYKLWNAIVDQNFEDSDWLGKENLIFFKQNQQSHFQKLEDWQWEIVQESLKSRSVQEILCDIQNQYDLNEENISQFFQFLLQANIVKAFKE